jgi:uncharacterized protein (DUF3820 family)
MNSENQEANEYIHPDNKVLLKLAKAKMPFGKYKGYLLVDLPEPYVVWFSRKGFPQGELGDMLRTVYEIKINGLEYLFKPLKDRCHQMNLSCFEHNNK